MWIAGLRGAMAYALAMESTKDPSFTGNSGKIMLIITLLYALFTILGVSSFLNPIMQKCEVTRKELTEDEKELQRLQENSRDKGLCARLKIKLAYFDRYYFSPHFIKDSDKIDKRD